MRSTGWPSRVIGCVDRLNSGRAVHMGDCLQALLPSGIDVVHEKHVRTGDWSAAEDSAARSVSTIGATGRNCSRPLMSLRRSTLSPRAGWASKERCPERPWPVLGATLEPGDDPVLGDDLAAAAAMSDGRSKGTRAVLRASSIWWSPSRVPRPRWSSVRARRRPRQPP